MSATTIATPADIFWNNLNAACGKAHLTIGKLEAAAQLGGGTLRKVRAAGGMPNLETVLRVSRHLGLQPVDLMGDATPPELRMPAPANDDALRRIKLANLTPSHLNPRREMDEEALAELADSIAAQGLLQNLVVRQEPTQPALWWIVAGERRYRALELLRAGGRLPADLAEGGIPCRIVAGTDADHIVLALLENMQRQTVNPMDEAEAIARLHALDPVKWSTKNIAERLGVTQRQVQLRLQLANKLTDDAKQQLRAGTIHVAQAKVLASLPEPQQIELLPEAAECTAQDLAERVSEDMIDVAVAIFDVEQSGLDIWTDPATDTQFFTDRDAFFTAQDAAVQAMRGTLLDAGASFVALVGSAWDVKAYAEGGTGTVVLFRRHFGDVEVFANRHPKSEPSAASVQSLDDRHAMLAAQSDYRQKHQAAARTFVSAVAGSLTHAEALTLLVWDAVVPFSDRVLRGTGGDNLGVKVTLDEMGELIGTKGSGAKDAKRIFAAWEHLAKHVTADSIERAATAAIADCLALPDEHKALSPVLQSIAERLSIDIPPILLDTPRQRDERIAQIRSAAEGQTDIEDAIADATP